MFNKYFEQELANLKELGKKFSERHPAIAPMLSSQSADPDVERLLEGVAFLTGLLKQKLDDEFPEIVNELVQLIWPHYLRPMPSSTIMAFESNTAIKQPVHIPRGVQVSSVPVEGTRCHFKTCYDVTLYPIELVDAAYIERSGKASHIRLLFELTGMTLSDWRPDQLRFFISGPNAHAANIYYLMRHCLRQIIIQSASKEKSLLLDASHIKPVGFDSDQSLLPYPSNAFPGYRILQEYFLLTEKFLFFDLVGLDKWDSPGKGNQFEILFELDQVPFGPLNINKDNFVLSATPAINIFSHESDPIRLDHKKTEYLVRPSGKNPEHYQIYSINRVIGFVQGRAAERVYYPFDLFTPKTENKSIYHHTIRKSSTDKGIDVFLSIAYPENIRYSLMETLSLKCECTNGTLPDGIQIGDIKESAETSPEFARFRNLTVPTSSLMPPLGTDFMWQLLSHLSLNYVSLESAENLRTVLELYNFENTRNRSLYLAYQKRIKGIRDISCSTSNSLVSGVIMRGRDIQLKMHPDHFASRGDLFLFGCILDSFLSSYASLNTYTAFSVQDVLKGDFIKWPAKIGDRPLI